MLEKKTAKEQTRLEKTIAEAEKAWQDFDRAHEESKHHLEKMAESLKEGKIKEYYKALFGYGKAEIKKILLSRKLMNLHRRAEILNKRLEKHQIKLYKSTTFKQLKKIIRNHNFYQKLLSKEQKELEKDLEKVKQSHDELHRSQEESKQYLEKMIIAKTEGKKGSYFKALFGYAKAELKKTKALFGYGRHLKNAEKLKRRIEKHKSIVNKLKNEMYKKMEGNVGRQITPKGNNENPEELLLKADKYDQERSKAEMKSKKHMEHAIISYKKGDTIGAVKGIFGYTGWKAKEINNALGFAKHAKKAETLSQDKNSNTGVLNMQKLRRNLQNRGGKR